MNKFTRSRYTQPEISVEKWTFLNQILTQKFRIWISCALIFSKYPFYLDFELNLYYESPFEQMGSFD